MDEQIEAVQRMQDYIDTHLTDNITLAVQAAINKYDPAAIDARWDESNPRIQLEPIGTRGYIELLPIK